MNTPSNAMPEARLDPQVIAPAAVQTKRTLYWPVRRELWENRYIYLAFLLVAAVFLLGLLIDLIRLAHRMRSGLLLDPVAQRDAFEMPYNIAADVIMATMMILQAYYCLDALYGERRDRSILFWKSLPVSDLTTVLSKLSVPILILPLLAFAITFVTQIFVRLISSAVLAGSGLHVATRWTQQSFFQVSLMLLYHLLTAHALWYAPFYGYLLLVSAWAKRAPLLWAVLPPLAIAGLEKILFDSSYFAALLKYRFAGAETYHPMTPGSVTMDPLHHMDLLRFLGTPGLWTGLALTAICLTGAVLLRRRRGPI
jgi:ABC-2 type transport system permease protein